MERFSLIVFEGCDNSGKTTQAELLAKKIDAIFISFPVRSTETGNKINNYLKGKIKYSNKDIHSLFVQNRLEFNEYIRDKIFENNIIIDRYSHSGIVYGIASGLDKDYCILSESSFLKPDAVFLLNNNVYNGPEVYENVEFQQKVKDIYNNFIDKNWYKFDSSNLSIEALHEQIFITANEIISQKKYGLVNFNS